jgi:Secretion system C-terminal sorting domain
MKKVLQLLLILFLLIPVGIDSWVGNYSFLTTAYRTLYGDTTLYYSITGQVLFNDNEISVGSGYVKALRYDWAKDMIITVDSAVISPQDGTYELPHCSKDSMFIMAYADDEWGDFPPGYYDTTIDWTNSKVVKPSSNVYNLNIKVNRFDVNETGNHRISGNIHKEPQNPNDMIEDAVVYAKLGNRFKGCGISDNKGRYIIDSLPPGNYELLVNRIGYYTDYRLIQVGQFYTDSVDFYLTHIATVKDPKTIVPKKFSLEQNYPNPFNPVTKIKFAIPLSRGVSDGRSALAKLIIYDFLGRQVATLVNGKLAPGTYEVEWDGTNYPSGVYFYKFVTSEFTETRKMVLVK